MTCWANRVHTNAKHRLTFLFCFFFGGAIFLAYLYCRCISFHPHPYPHPEKYSIPINLCVLYPLIYVGFTAVCSAYSYRPITLCSYSVHTISECRCIHVTFLVIVHAPGSHGQMHTFQEAHGGGENMAKNEKFERLIELVQKHTILYNLACPGHPNYDWRGLPQFFLISTFPEISILHMWIRLSFSGEF